MAKILATLGEPIEVKLWVTTPTPKLAAFARSLDDRLAAYERLAPGKMHHRTIEVKSVEQMAAAKEAGLQEMVIGDDEQTEHYRGFFGLSFKYKIEKDQIPVLDPSATSGLDFWIANKLREIRDRADNRFVRIGIITQKGEIKLTDQNLIAARQGAGPTLSGILNEALPFYKVEDVDLQGGKAEINRELLALIITQPSTPYSERELRRIDQFLMLGNKAIAIFASAVNLKASDASMKATLDTWGLEKLLDAYGIEMKKEAVLDWGRSVDVAAQTSTGQPVTMRAPGIVLVEPENKSGAAQTLDSTFAAFFRLDQVSFPFPSPLVAHPDKQPDAKLRTVARTTARATIVASDPIDMKISPNWTEHGKAAQQALSIVVEGKIKSAFGGKDGEGVTGVPPVSKASSRLLVVSSSEFLANPFARAGNGPPMPPQMQMMGPAGGDEDLQTLAQPYAQKYLTATILAFKNTLDWMTGDDDIIACSATLLTK